jgi:IS6 family transposase
VLRQTGAVALTLAD